MLGSRQVCSLLGSWCISLICLTSMICTNKNNTGKLCFTGQLEWLYSHCKHSDIMVRATKPSLAWFIWIKQHFWGRTKKEDFCGTSTCDLQLSMLMLYLPSQGAHPASMPTSSSLRTPSTQILLTLVGCGWFCVTWWCLLLANYVSLGSLSDCTITENTQA